jgi:hypothetical protein
MNPAKYAPLAVQDSKDLECCEQHEQLEEENSRWHSLIGTPGYLTHEDVAGT